MGFIEEMLKARDKYMQEIERFGDDYKGGVLEGNINVTSRRAKIEMIDFAIGTFLASQEEETVKPSKQEKSHVTMKIMSDIDNMIYIVSDELKKYVNIGEKVSVKTIGEHGFKDVVVQSIITGGGHTIRGMVTGVWTNGGWVKSSYTDVL